MLEPINKSYYKNFNNNEEWYSSFNTDCFSVLDYGQTKYQVHIEVGDAHRIEKPSFC